MKNLTPLGHARVFRHPLTGELVVDTDSLRRTQFAGADDFGGWDDDDFEGDYDEFEGDYDDDFEGDDFGLFRKDPDRQRARRERRMARKRGRVERRYDRRTDRLDRKADKWGLNDDDDGPSPQKSDRGWGMTAIGGVVDLDEAGPATIRVRLQHDFRAEDITFTGSSEGATVTSIFFGDRVVWSTNDGIDASVFAAQGFLRGLLKGQSVKAGLDVTINGALQDKGVFSATLTGKKPVKDAC